MNPSVRWLYTTDTHQQRPALCILHEDGVLCVQAGSIVRVIVRTQKEFAGMRAVVNDDDGAAYPVDKAAAKLREVGRRIGITKQAETVLLAIEDNDKELLAGVTFVDEEGKTMRNDDDGDETETGGEESGATTVVVKKKLPPPRSAAPSPGAFTRKAKTVAAPAATKESSKSTTPVKGTKEKTVAAKKNVKAKAKSKKVVAKKAAAVAGEGGFRVGSNMEKGFIAYKAARKDYLGFERGDKQVWAQKLADKLNTTLNSVRTMISKNWEPLLTK